MFSLLLAAVLEFTPTDAHVAFEAARSLVEECSPRDAGTIRGRIAANKILDLASASGADVRRDGFTVQTPQGERRMTNLYASFKGGTNDEWVVVLSHFDTKSGVKCPGANDGASTSGLLIGLCEAISRNRALEGNILLIWTDGEECMVSYGPNDGFWGSQRAVEHIKNLSLKVKAVICLDMLGDSDLSISVPANGDKKLADLAIAASEKAGYPGLVKRTDELVKDDHLAFLKGGYKAIDLIDFSYGPKNSFWHSEQDTLQNISEGSLLKSGKVVTALINSLL